MVLALFGNPLDKGVVDSIIDAMRIWTYIDCSCWTAQRSIGMTSIQAEEPAVLTILGWPYNAYG